MTRKLWILAGAFALAVFCSNVSGEESWEKSIHAQFNTDELRQNRGEPYRLSLAELSRFSRRSDAAVWEFNETDWMKKNRDGELRLFSEILDAHPSKRLGELLDVYRFPFDGNAGEEFLVLGRSGKGIQGTFGATLYVEREGELQMVYRPTELPGERYRVWDIRDHNQDGRMELILAGEGGAGDYYTYFLALSVGEDGILQKRILQAPETMHLVDLDQDKQLEFLVRKVASRRGGRPLFWTLVDEVCSWNGQQFRVEPPRFRGFHDGETKPKLIDELIDFSGEDLLLLETKIEVLRQVHAHVVADTPIGVRRDKSVVFARKALEKGRKKRARTLLERAVEEDPYRVEALYELARLEMWAGRQRRAIALLYSALGVNPASGPVWMTLGLSFAKEGETKTAIAAMVNSARLSEEPEARLAKLQRLSSTYRDRDIRKVIGDAASRAEALIRADERELEEEIGSESSESEGVKE